MTSEINICFLNLMGLLILFNSSIHGALRTNLQGYSSSKEINLQHAIDKRYLGGPLTNIFNSIKDPLIARSQIP